MLCRYRKDLLCRTHEAQRQLECKDHFIYQMENGGPGICETVCGTSCDGREGRKKSRDKKKKNDNNENDKEEDEEGAE